MHIIHFKDIKPGMYIRVKNKIGSNWDWMGKHFVVDEIVYVEGKSRPKEFTTTTTKYHTKFIDTNLKCNRVKYSNAPPIKIYLLDETETLAAKLMGGN